MQLKRHHRLPVLLAVLLVGVLLSSVIASVRAYVVLNRSFPPPIAYEGGEVPGEMTVFPGYRISNTAQGCGRYYEISFATMHGTIHPEMWVYLHVIEDGHHLEESNIDDFKSVAHDGEEIILPNPCTLVKEPIGRVISIRPKVEPVSCEWDYTSYIPGNVAARIELYDKAWPVLLTNETPRTNVSNAAYFNWPACP